MPSPDDAQASRGEPRGLETSSPITELLLLPPFAVARVGGSVTPLENYSWTEDPTQFAAGQTVIKPEATIEVSRDGNQSVYLPAQIRFSDGDKIRPVCPFLEIWCRRGNSKPEPLTIALLYAEGASLENITYEVTAANRKAARRTGDEGCSYSASIVVSAADFRKQPLLASSPQTEGKRLIGEDKPILLGAFQPLRPVHARGGNSQIKCGIDLGTIRARFTPAKGEVYGPPSPNTSADPVSKRVYEIVPVSNRLTNPEAAWNFHGGNQGAPPSIPGLTDPPPQGTFDGDTDPLRSGGSLGVVDDTCDVVVRARLAWDGKCLVSTSRLVCGPPDFAPDRRPFFSLADDFSDRDPDVFLSSPSDAELQEYIFDLFRRTYETASLVNVDRYRLRMIPTNPAGLSERFPILPRTDDGSMRGSRNGGNDSDFLSDEGTEQLTDAGDGDPNRERDLVRSRLAEERHSVLADPMALIDEINDDVKSLFKRVIRPAYKLFRDLAPDPGNAAGPEEYRDVRVDRDRAFDMRMPPYMRDSDGFALSLTARQYRFLLDYLSRKDLRTPAAVHRDQVISRRKEAEKTVLPKKNVR